MRLKKPHTTSSRHIKKDRKLQGHAAGTREQDADGDAAERNSVAANRRVSITRPRKATERR
jgi:hypothetical protein